MSMLPALKDIIGTPATFWLANLTLALTLAACTVAAARIPGTAHAELQGAVGLTLLFAMITSTCPGVLGAALNDTVTASSSNNPILTFVLIPSAVVLYSLLRLRGGMELCRQSKHQEIGVMRKICDPAFRNIIGTQQEDFEPIRKYHNRFTADMEALGTSKLVTCHFSEDDITIMFFEGIGIYYYFEWKAAMAQRYSIGGVGEGPKLSVHEIKMMAEEEDGRAFWKKTVPDGDMSPEWRIACVVGAAIVYPIVVAGVMVQ